MGKTGVVYIIQNKYTGKTYFGETTRDGETRLHEHLLALKKGVERNKALQRDFTKEGVENFRFEVILATKHHKLCELVLIELFSRIGSCYKQRRGNQIQKVLSGELDMPLGVYIEVQFYINQNYADNQRRQLHNELKDIKENGFQCKSDEIFNRQFKNLFLSSYSLSTRRVDECRFKKVAKFEKMYNKDLHDFTLEEATQYLYSLRAKSLRSIQNHISRLRKYLSYAINNGVSSNKTNYYDGLSKSYIASKYLLITNSSHVN